MKCDQLQKIFSDALLAKDYDQSESDVFRQLLSSEGRVSTFAGLKAYRGNWRAGLRVALEDYYPAVFGLLGEECFGYLAAGFTDQNPAQTHDLNWYGEAFSTYVAEEFTELPYLREVARLDWLWHRMFYLKDQHPISAAEIEQAMELELDQIYFKASNSLTLLHSTYPLEEIWNYGCRKAESEAISFESDACSSSVAIWRQGYIQKIKTLNTIENEFLKAMLAGNSYGQIAESSLSDLSESELTGLLGQAIQSQWIVGFEAFEK